MKKQHPHDVARPFIALLAAFAFVFSPFTVLAQQAADQEEREEQQESDDADDADDAEEENPAGPTPKVVLLPTLGVRDQMSRIIPDRVGERVRSQLESKSAIELMPAFEKTLTSSDGQTNAAVGEAERLYTSGIGLLTAGEDDKASETFQKAVDLMEENLTELQNFDVLADAYKNLALAYFNAGFDFDARKKIKVFAHLRPEAELDPEQFPKKLRELYASEAGKVKKGGPGKLTVESDVEGATVVIDGEEKGSTPLTVEDVGYGYHYLVVRASSGAAAAEQIQVRGRGKAQTFELELGNTAKAEESDVDELPAFYSGLISSVETGNFGEDLDPYLAELISRSGADYVAWIALVKRNMTYEAVPFVYRASDSQLVQAKTVEFNIELSNLRVGVSRLGDHIASAIVSMPEERFVSSVQLIEPPAADTEPAEGDDDEAVADADEATDTSETPDSEADRDEEKAASVEPPPRPSGKEADSNQWMWVGGVTAGVLLTGLVVGGVVYMDDGDDGGSQGFSTQLSW
ncbi:MAG: PEGA domain-containing protein [Persicimonas sp.]